jgi:DNA-binding MarR family transcriptional regulator
MNFSFKRPEDSPGFLLWKLSNSWQQQQRKALAKLGLTHGQFVVLAGVLWLSHQPTGHVTQQQVSVLTQIDKMTLSTIIQSLLRKELLERADHSKDKRAYALKLTELAQSKVLAAIPIVEGIDLKFFSPETEGLKGLVKILIARGVIYEK